MSAVNSVKAGILRHGGLLLMGLAALWLLGAGCSSTEVTNRERLVTEKLPYPGKIVVYDFVCNPADVAGDSDLSNPQQADTPAQTPEQIDLGKRLGTEIATQLVEKIKELGLPAVLGSSKNKLEVNDIVLRGYLVSVEQGEGVKRVVVGFGYGGAELRTLLEGYQMTAKGLRKLGSATIDAKGNKTPGGALGAVTFAANANPVGLIVGGAVKGYGEISGSSTISGRADATVDLIAEKLKVRFKEEGWIN